MKLNARNEVTNLNGLIIAGGRSTRMGADKALLPLGGKPLLAVLLERMAPHCGRIVIAAGDRERAAAYHATLAPLLPPELAKRVGYALDRYHGCGPLAGLHAGLSELPHGYALVMGCDMPLLSASLLDRMRATAAASAGGQPPVVHAAGQPFHALYHASMARKAQELMERGEYRFMRVLDQPDAAIVEPETDAERAAFTNLNTPEAYAAFAERNAER